MFGLFDSIAEWFRGILIDGIVANFTGMFDEVNTKVGEIAVQVGSTPAGWNASVYACYNVQTVVDDKHKLIVDFEVSTCPDDSGSLLKMTESAKEIMGVAEIIAVADKGYYNGEDIDACEKNKTTCYVPEVESKGRPAPNPDYSHDKFKYDSENNWYVCPEGNILYARKPRKKKNGILAPAYSNAADCHKCPKYAKCTNDKGGRQILRNPFQEALDAVNLRMETDGGRQIMRERKTIVEHPFGTTKYVWGFRQYLCRGVDKTTGEQSLTYLAYNIRRVANIFKENGRDLREVIAV